MSQLLEAKALVIDEAKGPFKLVDIELDLSKLKSDEVMVKYHHTGVCHTDIYFRNIALPHSLPAIYGHEGAGVVEHLSSTYTGDLKVGDSLLASFGSCGECNSCQSSRPAFCDLCGPMSESRLLLEMMSRHSDSDCQSYCCFLRSQIWAASPRTCNRSKFRIKLKMERKVKLSSSILVRAPS